MPGASGVLSPLLPLRRFNLNPPVTRALPSTLIPSRMLTPCLAIRATSWFPRRLRLAEWSSPTSVVATDAVFPSCDPEDVSVDRVREFEHLFGSPLRGDSFAVVSVRPVVPPEGVEFSRELVAVEACLGAAFVDRFVVDVLVFVEQSPFEQVELDGAFDPCERRLDYDRVVTLTAGLSLAITGRQDDPSQGTWSHSSSRRRSTDDMQARQTLQRTRL